MSTVDNSLDNSLNAILVLYDSSFPLMNRSSQREIDQTQIQMSWQITCSLWSALMLQMKRSEKLLLRIWKTSWKRVSFLILFNHPSFPLMNPSGCPTSGFEWSLTTFDVRCRYRQICGRDFCQVQSKAGATSSNYSAITTTCCSTADPFQPSTCSSESGDIWPRTRHWDCSISRGIAWRERIQF